MIENSRLQNDQGKSAKSRDFAIQTDVSRHELSYKLEAMTRVLSGDDIQKSRSSGIVMLAGT